MKLSELKILIRTLKMLGRDVTRVTFTELATEKPILAAEKVITDEEIKRILFQGDKK